MLTENPKYADYIPHEDPISSSILTSAEIIEKPKENEKFIILRYGSKQLLLEFDFSTQVCVTYLERQKPPSPPIEDETSQLYKIAKILIQKEANVVQKQFDYLFTSEIPTMIEWAKTKGDSIFHWTQKTIAQDGTYANFRCSFIPEKPIQEKAKFI